MSKVILVIDGEEVVLTEGGRRKDAPYAVYREPLEYQKLGVGKQPLIITVHKKPGWKPSDGIK